MAYHVDIKLETMKDKKLNYWISQNQKQVQFLTNDVEDLENRILVLEVKINSFLKADYEKLSKHHEEIWDKLDELREFETMLTGQIELLNEQFKMNIIGKFNDKEVVDSLQKIIFNSIGWELTNKVAD